MASNLTEEQHKKWLCNQFTLIGRPTLVFRVLSRFRAAGEIPSVRGITLDGKKITTARVDDIVAVY